MPETQDALLLKRRARRRLVGAIALVLLVVIVLPPVLDREPRPITQELSVQIPSQDSGKFNTRVLPPPASLPGGGTKAPGASDKPPGVQPEAKPAEPSKQAMAPPAPAAKSGAEADPGEARRAQALLNDEGYIVPLGLFSNPENAKHVRDKASAAGFNIYTEKVQGRQGEQTRVRAGPFENREAADKARDRLQSLGLAVGAVTPR